MLCTLSGMLIEVDTSKQRVWIKLLLVLLVFLFFLPSFISSHAFYLDFCISWNPPTPGLAFFPPFLDILSNSMALTYERERKSFYFSPSLFFREPCMKEMKSKGTGVGFNACNESFRAFSWSRTGGT